MHGSILVRARKKRNSINPLHQFQLPRESHFALRHLRYYVWYRLHHAQDRIFLYRAQLDDPVARVQGGLPANLRQRMGKDGGRRTKGIRPMGYRYGSG